MAADSPEELEAVIELDRTSAAGSVKRAELVRRYTVLSGQGEGAATWRLGQLYEEGDGVTADYAMAERLYRKAIAQGMAAAHLNLGFVYFQGLGRERDVPTAVDHFTQAAESGYRPAQLLLSRLYAEGRGVEVDPSAALRWAGEAALEDDPGAQTQLGNYASLGVGVERDDLLARDWYQLAAEQDYSDAMMLMGKNLIDAGDLATGAQWLELASQAGNLDAAFLTAVLAVQVAREKLMPAGDELVKNLIAAVLLQGMETLAERGQSHADEVVELVRGGRDIFAAVDYVLEQPFTQRLQERSAIAAAKPMQTELGTLMPPILIRAHEVKIPAIADLGDVTGSTRVQFSIDKEGKVYGAKVLDPIHPALAEALVTAIRQWRYRPGTLNGEPVELEIINEFDFTKTRLTPLGGGERE